MASSSVAGSTTPRFRRGASPFWSDTKTCAPNDRTFVFGSSLSEMGTPSA